MSKCKWCEQKSIFLMVDEFGLCNNCSQGIRVEYNSRMKVVRESLAIMQSSKNIDTIASRYSIIMEHVQRFKEFEAKGLIIDGFVRTETFDNLWEGKDLLIFQNVQKEIDNLVEKAKSTTTPKTQINIFTKALVLIDHAKELTTNDTPLEKAREQTAGVIHQIQLETHLEEAKKAEFKGGYKKALDSYLDALYFLRNDGIDDAEQYKIIDPIEEKISELKERISQQK